MRTGNLKSVKGVIHDLQVIDGLSDEPCNIRFMSDRSLYILQNLSGEDVQFPTRYLWALEGNGLYSYPVPGDAEYQIETDAIDILRRDLNMTCDDIVTAINGLAQVLASVACGCPVGQGSDSSDGEAGGDVPASVGDIVYQEPVVVSDRGCKAANLVHQTLLDIFVELDAYNVDDMASLGLVAVVSLITALLSLVASPLVGLTVAVAGVVAAFGAKLVGVTVALSDIVAVMEDDDVNLVCALYEATSASSARAAYIAQLQSNVGIGVAEGQLVQLIMTNSLLNILFFDTEETAGYWDTYTPLIDCAACVAGVCELNFYVEGGTTPQGEGDLSIGGPRVLTAVQSINTNYYVIFQVGPPTSDQNYNTCNGVDPSCYGSFDRYKVRVISATETVTVNATECSSGTPGITLSGGAPDTGEFAASYVEIFAAVPFTATVEIGDWYA